MAKRYRVELAEEERRYLRGLIAAGTAPASKLAHARILLKADQAPGGPGWVDTVIAEAVEEAVALAEGGPAGAAAPAAGPPPGRAGPLTPREREVAVLVARGRTNPQVAQALVIAPRTAGRHVEHVMAKLGVHSRAEIGAWAAQQGLLVSGGA